MAEKDYLALAVKKLRNRSYSIQEIRQYLVGLGIDKEELEKVLERLRILGYLNDFRLAEQLYHSYRRGKPCGYLLWREKLRQRGIASEIIEEFRGRCTAEDEYSNARRLAEAYLNKPSKKEPLQRMRGLATMLQRRCFAAEIVGRIIREYQENLGSASGQ